MQFSAQEQTHDAFNWEMAQLCFIDVVLILLKYNT